MLIAHTLHSGEKAGIPVSVCGELAGDPNLTRLLLGMGLRTFSMHPAQILGSEESRPEERCFGDRTAGAQDAASGRAWQNPRAAGATQRRRGLTILPGCG